MPVRVVATSQSEEEDTTLCCPPLTEAPLSTGHAAELASVLGALADPVRLRLLSLVASQGEVCSCNLEEPLGKSQPTVSHHTGCLPRPASSLASDVASGCGGQSSLTGSPYSAGC